jgi:integrase
MLCDKYKDSTDLGDARDLCMILISFAGFLRFDELISLVCSDINFKESYINIDIQKSKNDQYRQGEEILISEGSASVCPVRMLKS